MDHLQKFRPGFFTFYFPSFQLLYKLVQACTSLYKSRKVFCGFPDVSHQTSVTWAIKPAVYVPLAGYRHTARKPVGYGCGVHTVPVVGAVSRVTGAVSEVPTWGLPVMFPIAQGRPLKRTHVIMDMDDV